MPVAARGPEIDFELTESSLLADVDASVQQLKALRDMGFGIAIDDFGTGYSSLNQPGTLTRRYAEDRQILCAAHDVDHNVAAVVASITLLAQSMQLNTVAEGVETQEQLDRLRQVRLLRVSGVSLQPASVGSRLRPSYCMQP